MAVVKRTMERHGWELIGAWSTVIGDLHEVHDLWRVDDANAVPSGFAAAYEEADPEFLQATQRIAEITDREALSLVSKTPYSP
jgi:hypothetical protein